MGKPTPVLVTRSGFIGGHLVDRLLQEGSASVRSVDIKLFAEWYLGRDGTDNRRLDVSYSRRAASRSTATASSTTWRPTWAAWSLSRATRPPACCRC